MSEPQERLKTNLEKMKRLMLGHVTGDGVHPTAIDEVKLVRPLSGASRGVVLYQPSIYVQVSGVKRGLWGESPFICDANQFMVFPAATSLEVMTEPSDVDSPALGISIRIGLPILLELMHKLGKQGDKVSQSEMASPAPLNLEMSEAVIRLLRSLESDTDAKILGPSVVRELIYRVMIGPRGAALRSMLNRTHQSGKIYSALEWIHRNYQRPLNIPDIANEVCMSVSAFHHSFKEITGSSPLQYIKSVRLQRARLHIKYDRLGAWIAGAKVGYESPSQFSRDFKRHFGYSPTEEDSGRKPRVQLRDSAASADSTFVPASSPLPCEPQPLGLIVGDGNRDEDDHRGAEHVVI
jgi:AraC-like DNA-binding protein